eukprot:TRINITY_DN13566_c0_g1_i1.p1 TRINITY_DN13566_c0_g1~~TRINITY_DN13566_c0_g1_i1.p1  ORF type:complete len:308 (+),score=45.83 TRINITY_DN13566_c0_g1_i1:32-925(+)
MDVLPDDVWSLIIEQLPTKSIGNMRRTCAGIRRLFEEDALWQRLCQVHYNVASLLSSGWEETYKECTLGGNIRVLVLSYQDQRYMDDIVNNLQLAGLRHVTGFHAIGAVKDDFPDPHMYDAVFLATDAGCNDTDSRGFGDNLALFLEGGGGVVTSMFQLSSSLRIGGRFSNDSMEAFATSDLSEASNLCLHRPPDAELTEEGRFLLRNVNEFHGGQVSFRCAADKGFEDTAVVARYSDGVPLLGYRQIKKGMSVSINCYLASNNVDPRFWHSSVDGWQMIRNALVFSVIRGKRRLIV